MREKYESGLIRNEHEFKEMLNNVLSIALPKNTAHS